MDINVIKNALDYKKQHLHLAHYLLNKECSISTFVEGQIDLKKSTNYEKLRIFTVCRWGWNLYL